MTVMVSIFVNEIHEDTVPMPTLPRVGESIDLGDHRKYVVTEVHYPWDDDFVQINVREVT